jgi:predicted enzyme related to lactoylglutathione lyase
MKIGISIDVDDIERAVDFYTRGIGLSVVERGSDCGSDWAHLTHEGQTIFIMQLPPGSDAIENAHSPRNYSRHWTPVHLDFVVADIDQAVECALAAGAKLDRPIQCRQTLADMANMSDPFGNGFDLIQERKQN